MVEVVITGIGLVSALSNNLEASWKLLLAGETGIKIYQPFSDIPAKPLGMIGPVPTDLFALTQQVVMAAVADAGWVLPQPDCGVVIGSSRAHQGQWENLARQRMAVPDCETSERQNLWGCNWLETLPHTPALSVARYLGSTGPVLALMTACATGILTLAQAFELIRTGQCQRVLAGAVETPVTPLTLAGFTQMGALAVNGCYPFDRHRQGFVLGEAGVMFCLESADLAHQRSAKIYGKILGFALTNDASYANSPDLEGRSADIAIKQCLDRSRLLPCDIDYIHAHGTGTILNDRCEANLIRRLFPQGVPVSSTKAATGHTLGASGALGVAFSLMALRDQIVPPCVGLRESEFDLNLIKLAGEAHLSHVLCLSFGFGGQNAAICLAKMPTNIKQA